MIVERVVPSGRAAWLALRRQDVTASQIGALFGVHDFTSPYALWALKTGRVHDEVEETPVMQRGRLLEPVAVKLLLEDHPTWTIEHNSEANVYFRSPDHRIGATPDVIVHAPGRGKGVVQIKSVEASVFRKKWLDEDGNVEVPLWIVLQATLEAHLVGASWAAVAPLVVGHGLEMPLIEIPLVEGVFVAMLAKVDAFWTMVAEGREPHPDYGRDGEVIEAIYGDGNAENEIDLSADNRIRELVAVRAMHRAAITHAHKMADEIDAEVKAKLGSAHVAHLGQGQRISWRPSRREGFFVAPSTVRTLRYPTEKD